MTNIALPTKTWALLLGPPPALKMTKMTRVAGVTQAEHGSSKNMVSSKSFLLKRFSDEGTHWDSSLLVTLTLWDTPVLFAPPLSLPQWKLQSRLKCSLSLSGVFCQGWPKHNRNQNVPNSFASDAASKRHLMAHRMKNLCLFCGEGAFGAASGGTPKLRGPNWGLFLYQRVRHQRPLTAINGH